MNKIESQINQLLEDNIIKRTGLFLFDAINNFKISDDNLFLFESIYGIYLDYINSLKTLEDYKDPFLKTLKQEEIKRNQVLENVSGFLVQVYMNSNHRSATNIAIKAKIDGIANERLILRMHKNILTGIAKSSEIESKYRTKNTTYVGTGITHNGQLIGIDKVSYLPIDYNDIPEAINKILDLYNTTNISSLEDIFINPILIHGIVAALQIFTDGNTRLARVLEHVQLWDLTNLANPKLDLESPAIYTSEAIMRLYNREEYRNLIEGLAINPSDENINAWIEFNINLIEKQIYFNQDKIAECHKTLQRRKK